MIKEECIKYFEIAHELSENYLKSLALKMHNIAEKDSSNLTTCFVMAHLSFLITLTDYIEIVKEMGGDMDLKTLTKILLKMDKDLEKQIKEQS